MRYKVLLTAGAESDIDDLHSYIAAHDSQDRADRVLDRLMEVADNLAEFPERGSHPPPRPASRLSPGKPCTRRRSVSRIR